MPDIPLSKIHANPKNPRRVITQEMIDNMAASLEAVGLKNDIKLNVLPPSGDKPDGSYELISGHIRFAAAQKLGWETISAQLLTLTPEQALLESILDNRGQPMNWLETAEAVESLMQARPKPTQEAVGKMLGISQKEVSKKMAILGLLTPAARQVIYTQGIKYPENALIPQKVVAVLVTLKDEDLIEKTLGVAIDRKMITEAEAQKLVFHVGAGNTPKSYTGVSAKKASGIQTPHAPHASHPPVTTTIPPAQPAQTKESVLETKVINILSELMAIAVVVWLFWLACKGVVWAVTAFIHWL